MKTLSPRNGGRMMAKEPQKTEKKSNRLIGRRYRYADDYQIVPALAGNGRGQRVIYNGQWILPTNDPEQYKKLVLWMRILTAMVLVALLAAIDLVPAPNTHKWYLPILVGALYPLSYQVMGVATIPARIRHMERRQYDKSFLRAGHSATFTVVMLCLSALACLIYWLVAAFGTIEDEAPYSLADGGFAFLLILSVAAELTVRRLARKVETETLEHDAYQA